MLFSVLFMILITTAPSYQSDDYALSINIIMNKFLAGIGLTANHIFNTGPARPIEEEVSFYCILPNSNTFRKTYLNDPDISSIVDLSKPVGILTHGWIDSFRGGFLNTENIGWMDTTATNWANNASITVCAVDWSRLANYEYIISATQNTKLVGAHIGDFLRFLNGLGISYRDMTVAGHSLGGQISGFVGAHLNSQLGRIIALDPAGPAFTFPIDFGKANRLDADDAVFVEVLHTAAGTLGTSFTCGDADYWPNGGLIQSGCILGGLIGPPGDSPEAISCSHLRAVQFYRSSLSANNRFLGRICINHASYLSMPMSLLIGACRDVVDVLGIWSNRTPGSFYLNTQMFHPFALN